MRKRSAIGCTMFLALAAAIWCSDGSVKAQQNTRTSAMGTFEVTAAGAQAGMPAAATSASHTELMKLAGDYDRTVKFLGQTGAMAAPSQGTCKITVVLGGRFLMEESHDTVFGKPVDGLRIYGYNDATKQYEMARMYTMSNAITLMKGTSSDGGKTIDYEGGAAGTGNATLHAKLERVNDDEFTVTMSATDASGKDAPFQETIYKRKSRQR
ncbi:MAG TPA: DUF1579 family protein [Candidatus Acidoferrales bacterium]|nr:DUF1579 family protein [Candidatus Acidoferrales bacterium]